MGATASGKLALARFYDGTENDMTVREAFERSGHPVPYMWLLREVNPSNDSIWYAMEDPFSFGQSMFSPSLGRWVDPGSIIAELNWNPDYTNDPASAFLQALPQCVRDAICRGGE